MQKKKKKEPLDHHQHCKQQNPVYSNNRGQSLVIAPNAPEPLLRADDDDDDDDDGGGGALQTHSSNPTSQIFIF